MTFSADDLDESNARQIERRRLRVVGQDLDVIVLGTDQVREAADLAGLDNDKGIYWEGSHPGLLARRNKRWVFVSDYAPPKDAKPGVVFYMVRFDDLRAPNA